jgi:hypothetical protein
MRICSFDYGIKTAEDKSMLLNRCIALLLIFSWNILFGQTETKVTIRGHAPAYVGKTILAAEIDDYLSQKESQLNSVIVGPDSTFQLSFYVKETQKIVLHADRNVSYLYVQPGALYDVYLPEKDKFDPMRPNGSNIEITFLDLDSNDINYRILEFQRWCDEFVGSYFYLKNIKPLEFSKKLDEFKMVVDKYYHLTDTSNTTLSDPRKYFVTFVRFSIASLDNIQHAAQRNRYEKHDFYLKYTPVSYRNDAYMGYLNSFYERLIPRLSTETNNRVYAGLLKSSPTLIMKALGTEYTLINMRIREIVMIKALSEEFYSKDFPQTNILTVLDSVANHSLFSANGILARNMIYRLTELLPGGKAPDLVLISDKGEVITLGSLPKKHVYLHFYDASSQKSTQELEPLKKLYEIYKEDIIFISIYPDKPYNQEVIDKFIKTIPWITAKTKENNPIWKNYKITTYPMYVLLDGYGYVVAAPALSPMPDGQYQTIEKTFFSIQKTNKEMKGK